MAPTVTEAQPAIPVPDKISIALVVNGAETPLEVAPWTTLLDALRDHLDLTGTKKGCDHGQCGACTVLIGGRAVRSCITPTSAVAGQEITTLEGLSQNGRLDPVQQAWIDEQVPQCGFCQNGQILTAKVLLANNPNPSDAEIRQGMEGALCRCMTYYRIQAAVNRAARTRAAANEEVTA